MIKLLQGPAAPASTEPQRRVDQPEDVAVATRRKAPAPGRRDRLQAVGEVVLGWPLGIAIVAVQLLLYACAVLAVPVLPFFLPLGLFPVAFFAALFIVGIGKVITSFGVGQWWL